MKRTLATLLVALASALLQACGSDFASPFDKPDETTQPVTQGDDSQ